MVGQLGRHRVVDQVASIKYDHVSAASIQCLHYALEIVELEQVVRVQWSQSDTSIQVVGSIQPLGRLVLVQQHVSTNELRHYSTKFSNFLFCAYEIVDGALKEYK